MINENIQNMRKSLGLSHEDLAEKVHVSRQTVAKWESGDSVPDINQCNVLAEIFDISLDELANYQDVHRTKGVPPKGKYIFGTVTVGERGQIVIPAKARRIFDIKPGDDLILLGDINQGLALQKADVFLMMADMIRNKEGK